MRYIPDCRQSGSYLSVPSSLMAIGLDIRRPAKEDFMSFSVLHEIGSEVIPGRHKRMRELRGDWREPLGTRVLPTSYVVPAADSRGAGPVIS